MNPIVKLIYINMLKTNHMMFNNPLIKCIFEMLEFKNKYKTKRSRDNDNSKYKLLKKYILGNFNE